MGRRKYQSSLITEYQKTAMYGQLEQHLSEVIKQLPVICFTPDESLSCSQWEPDNAMKKLRRNVLVVLCWPSAALAADVPESGGLLLSLLVPLIAVTLALLAMLWWLRRGKASSGSGPLKVVQAVAVGSRERVVVLDAQGRRLVLGVTPNKIELIAELHVKDISKETL